VQPRQRHNSNPRPRRRTKATASGRGLLEQTAREAFQENQETGFGRVVRTVDPEVPGYVFWPTIFGVGAICGLVVLGGF
jgi:exonuclease III